MCRSAHTIHFPADSLLWAQWLPHYHAAPAITAGTSNTKNAHLNTRMLTVAQRFRAKLARGAGVGQKGRANHRAQAGENLRDDLRTTEPFCFHARGSFRPWLAQAHGSPLAARIHPRHPSTNSPNTHPSCACSEREGKRRIASPRENA